MCPAKHIRSQISKKSRRHYQLNDLTLGVTVEIRLEPKDSPVTSEFKSTAIAEDEKAMDIKKESTHSE